MKTVGIYNPYLETKGGGEKVCLAMAAALSKSPNYSVELICHGDVNLKKLEKYFNIDLSRVTLRKMEFQSLFLKVLQRLPLPGRIKMFFQDIKAFRTIKKRRYDIFINNCYQSSLPNPASYGVYMCMFPQKLAQSIELSLIKRPYYLVMDLLYRIFMHPAHQSGVYSYQTITANSAYTRSYIKKYWNRDSDIIYPICEDMRSSKKVDKQKVILSVGRFFENNGENHHKRHDFMLETFAQMKKLHDEGWELHLAGSTAEDMGAFKYILELIKDASDLPVVFHFNASFKELKSLYNKASIYWHATGYGSSASKHPEKQEHFGIATVEAMSAGAIPVVFNTAGQKESVVPGENGMLWNTSTELKSYTEQVASLSEAERKRLASNGRKTAERFNNASFNKFILDYFDNLKVKNRR